MPDSGPAEPSRLSLLTDMEDEEEVTFENVHDLIMLEQGNVEDDLTQLEYNLPLYERCAVYQSSFGKCFALCSNYSGLTL